MDIRLMIDLGLAAAALTFAYKLYAMKVMHDQHRQGQIDRAKEAASDLSAMQTRLEQHEDDISELRDLSKRVFERLDELGRDIAFVRGQIERLVKQ